MGIPMYGQNKDGGDLAWALNTTSGGLYGTVTVAGDNAQYGAAATECFFGTIPLNSDVVDTGMGVPQQITYAVAIAAPASYDAMKFVAAAGPAFV